MITLEITNLILAVIVGTITAIVSSRMLRGVMGAKSSVSGICVGILSGLGLTNNAEIGGIMPFILIPYAALGISVVTMFLLKPFLKKGSDKTFSKEIPDTYQQTNDQNNNKTNDPWEEEINHGGRLANELKRPKQQA